MNYLVEAAAWSDDIPTMREAPRSGLLLEQGKLRWNLNTPANIKAVTLDMRALVRIILKSPGSDDESAKKLQ